MSNATPANSEPRHLDANGLEAMAKARPDDMFLKGSGVLKLTQAIRDLEAKNRGLQAEVAALKAPAQPGTEDAGYRDDNWWRGWNAAIRHWTLANLEQQEARAAATAQPAPAGADWWRKRADDIEATVAATGSREAMRCYTDMRTLLQAATAPPAPAAPFQQRVQPWLLECFGAEIAADRVERNHRFLEEALELVQTLGCTASEAHQLVDYVFGRPVGESAQEVGGVMVTLAALCLASGLDMHGAGEVELARIKVPELVAKIRVKQAAKPKHSPLAEAPSPAVHQVGTLSIAEAELLQKAVIDFDECGETDVPDADLLRFAAAGYLECVHYHVMPGARDAIDAALAQEGSAA